jgi:radical SAM superfamily enzyme
MDEKQINSPEDLSAFERMTAVRKEYEVGMVDLWECEKTNMYRLISDTIENAIESGEDHATVVHRITFDNMRTLGLRPDWKIQLDRLRFLNIIKDECKAISIKLRVYYRIHSDCIYFSWGEE